jgi:hypothetical protein
VQARAVSSMYDYLDATEAPGFILGMSIEMNASNASIRTVVFKVS